MLHFILGTDWKANRDEVLKRISEDVRHGLGGRILMVPELISHDMERRLAATAGDTASRYAEVLSFTRLARRVSESVGSAAMECLDDGGRVVAMAAASRLLHSKLKAYASVESKPEFLTELVDAVDEFKRCCITSSDLLSASKQTEGSLAQKLEELSMILETYDGLCQQGKRDPRDQMTWLLEELEEGDYGKDHVFYIDGFPDLTRQHLEILKHLIQMSPSVTVSINCDRVDSKAMAFEKGGSTAAEILHYAQKMEIPFEIHVVKPYDTKLQTVREHLFQGAIDTTASAHLRVYRADSAFQECEIAAEQIMELVHSGARYRDIGVVCTDMSVYESAIRMIFSRCHIPVYQSGTQDILQKNVISVVLSALDAALGGLEQKDVLRYLKSVLSPLPLSTCDLLENYAIQWGISGSRWLQPFVNHPDGLGKNWTEEDKERLQFLNEARATALNPLSDLRDGFRNAVNLQQQVQTLYTFLEQVEFPQKLEQLSNSFEAAGDLRNAQILNQLWEILLTALEQMYDVLGQTVWEPEVFIRLFTLLLSQYDVGTIPPVLDSVTAGPVSAMRCQQVKHLILLGAQEGNLPGYGGSKGVLTDQERVTLREMGVPLTGGAMDGLQAEFAEIYGVFCGADETITVTYPSGQPSFVLRRLAQMAQGEREAPVCLGASQASAREAGAYLAKWEDSAAAEKLGVFEAFSEIQRKKAHRLGKISEAAIRKLYGNQLNLSASQIDRQGECRLSYFLQYGLKAKERKEITVDPAEFGTYVHAVLEQMAKKVMQLGGFHQVSLKKTLEIAESCAQEYAQERFREIQSPRLNYLFHRNDRELNMVIEELWDEMSKSHFVPQSFELGFGDHEAMPAISLSGEKMKAKLRGYVDRVDVWQEGKQNYFRVVDYKTGKKDFDYCDIFNGIGLQMLLYLFALEQAGEEILGEHPTPAGVQYFPARAPILSADGSMTQEEAEKAREKEWKRKGILLRDEAVLEAMDTDGSFEKMSCKRKKDGTLDGDLADREQLRQLKTYLMNYLKKMIDEIASGNVDPNPYTRGTSHNACTYCAYREVCHADSVAGRRNYKAMTDKKFWEEIGKELKNDG